LVQEYPLSTGFLLDVLGRCFSGDAVEIPYFYIVDFPVKVQIIQISEERDGWKCVQVSDGQTALAQCGFVTKEDLPAVYSTIHILDILPWNIRQRPAIIQDFSPITRVFGEIIFLRTEGDKIGHPLHYIDETKCLSELQAIGDATSIYAVLKSINYVDPARTIMDKMWQDGLDEFSDVQFTFPQGDVLMAHKKILVSCSDVFQAHFAQSQQFADQLKVSIEDTSKFHFHKLLQFMYTGKVQFTTVGIAMELLYLSKKYLLHRLEDQARNTVKLHALNNPEKIVELMNLNRKCRDVEIQDFMSELLLENTRLVINSASFLLADFEAVEWILSQDDLQIDEWSLLQSLFRWAVFNQVAVTCNDENTEDHECLHQLFECVQFNKVGKNQLRRFLTCPKLGDVVPIEDFRNGVLQQVFLEDDPRTNDEHSMFRSIRNGKIQDRFCFEILFPESIVNPKGPGEFLLNTNREIQLSDGTKFDVMINVIGEEDCSAEVKAKLTYISGGKSDVRDVLYKQFENKMRVTGMGHDKRDVFDIKESNVLDSGWLWLIIVDYRDVLEQSIEQVGTVEDLKNVINLELQVNPGRQMNGSDEMTDSDVNASDNISNADSSDVSGELEN